MLSPLSSHRVVQALTGGRPIIIRKVDLDISYYARRQQAAGRGWEYNKQEIKRVCSHYQGLFLSGNTTPLCYYYKLCDSDCNLSAQQNPLDVSPGTQNE